MMSEVETWKKRISTAEKKWKEYHQLVEDIRKYYRNENKKNKQNIFWSSIETLKPFIYFKAPVPYVQRKDKTYNLVLDTACEILEKALNWDLESQDFDGVIKYARNDYLLSGLGLVYEQLKPKFKTVEIMGVDELGQPIAVQQEVLDEVKVESQYLDPIKLICDCNNVQVWEDLDWVAQVIDMTKQEVVDQFGKDVKDKLFNPSFSEEEEKDCPTKVYRIWSKKDKKIYWLSMEISDKFLRVDDDVLAVSGFFPFPKPVFATLANDGVIPTPDYSEIKCQLDELDGVNTRMKLTMQALKVSGAFDGAIPELANILDKDVTLVNVTDFSKLRERGGLTGCVDFMPIEQYVKTLEALAERRAMLVNSIYEITGVSDIMRGNSDPNETATAVTKKTNFGTLRNQDRQNDFQRFLTDVLRIKAEIICEQMPVEQLAQFSDKQPEIVMQAVQLLKEEKIRNLTLGIETDTSFNQSEEMAKTTDAVKLINEMINSSFSNISAQPALLPLYKQMVEALIVTLPQARQFGAVIDEVFNTIQQELSQPQPEQPDPDLIRAQAEVQKNQNELQVKQQANAIKEQEVQLKNQIEKGKLVLANKEMDIQDRLKSEELALKGQTNENITTGYVGAF